MKIEVYFELYEGVKRIINPVNYTNLKIIFLWNFKANFTLP